MESEQARLETQYRTLLKTYQEAKARYDSLASGTWSSNVPIVCNGRLTTQSNNPISTGNRTAQGTLYFSPYQGNRVSLYTAGRWQQLSFAQLNISLASGLAADSTYDVFVYNDGGTVALELGPAWTNATTRSIDLTSFGGVYVRSGDPTRRYLGTIRTVTASTTEDSASNRFVWNHHNRSARRFSFVDTANSWTYSGTAWQQAGNNSANTFNFVIGIKDALVRARALGFSGTAAALTWTSIGVGINSVTSNAASLMGGAANPNVGMATAGEYLGYPGVGFHQLNWIETTDGTNTVTFWGDNGNNRLRAGIEGWLDG